MTSACSSLLAACPTSLGALEVENRRFSAGVKRVTVCASARLSVRGKSLPRSSLHRCAAVCTPHTSGSGWSFADVGGIKSEGREPSMAVGKSELWGSTLETVVGNRRVCHDTTRRSSVPSTVVNVVMQPVRESAETKTRTTGKRRVVVTGLGVVSSLGHEPDVFYDNLLGGKSGISLVENFDTSDWPTKIAGEIKEFSHEGYVHPKMAKRMDKYIWYSMTAGKKALMDAGLKAFEALDKGRAGILLGSAMGGMHIFQEAIEALNTNYRRMNPFCIPFVTTNMGSAMLAMDLGWMGPNYSISTACATGNYCILSAANHIIKNEADVMLAGASDAAILPIGLGGFVACRALSKRNDDPTAASRPWDQGRDGFVMGEGAGVLVLEELEHAKARGATVIAEYLGGAVNCDGHHMTEPHPEGKGVWLCIETALKSSGVSRADVNYVNAHGTSTPAGDLQEYKALMKAFGANPELKINSTKSMIGHLLGAAGAVEAVATVQAIRTGYVHPNLNLDNPEKEVDMSRMVGSTKERLDIKVALSNSFGFGGHNSCVMFGPYKPDN